jgi:hypothetical protein
MPLQKLQFRPGINREGTDYSNEGGWYACDKVRFRSGYPEKIGGWIRLSSFTYLGVARSMWNWVTLNGQNLLGVGTNLKYYIENGGKYFDVTPIRETFTSPDTDNCFATTNTSNVITCTILNHGAVLNDFVTFSGSTDVGGIAAAFINQEQQITFASEDFFTFTVGTNATSTTTGGGNAITAAFQVNTGLTIAVSGTGWGAGAWGANTWGTSSLVPVKIFQRDWFIDNFDNDVVANIRDGAIYYWEYNGSFNTRAVLLSSLAGATDVPTEATQVLVSQNDKHLLCFGSTPFGGGSFDPLLIRWANQDEPTNWTPAPTNSAGFTRVSRGSRIVRALPTRQEILVWTDSHLYTLQFTGTTDVFSLQEYADNISIISPRSCISANNVTYWMGQDKFYAYSGRVETLPCTLRNYVFQDLNYDQIEQIVCGTSEQWHEIWWFYPSASAQTNDRYVIYNYLERIWYYGNINRTAWLDSPSRQYPQAVGGNFVYNHEEGLNDDTLPMTSFITTNDFDLQDGDQFVLIKRIIPDVNFEGSTAAAPKVVMTMRPRNFPGSNYSNTNEPDVERSTTVPIEQYTEQVFIRARARQMGFKIISEDLNVQWQLGAPRLDGRPDGKR